MGKRRIRFLTACVAGLGLLAAACSSSSGGSTSATSASGTTLAAATLNGSGSTFQAPFDLAAAPLFHSANPSVTVNYAGGGSGKGQSDLKAKLVQWAGSDSLVKKPSTFPAPFFYFPTVGGPITLSYNVSGVSKLILSASVLAGIFDGTITMWNDSAITKLNPGVPLPAAKITPVHRSDGSGTTANFTHYLTLAAPSEWRLGTASTVAFPVGVGAAGNPGVASLIKSTSDSIGYVDYTDAVATGQKMAEVINSSGKAIAPSVPAATAAIVGAKVSSNLTFDPLDSPNPSAYPITSATYVLVYQTQSNAAVGNALKAWLKFLLTTAQTQVAPKYNYASLPSALQQKALAQVNQIKV